MINTNVKEHYKQNELYNRITNAMSASGINIDSLTDEHFYRWINFIQWGN